MKPLDDVHGFLAQLPASTMKFGLDRMQAADRALGQPWRRWRTLHVAGTNGKGSTCAFAESLLRAHGLKVGLATSPHLEQVNERIRIDGRDVTDAELARAVQDVVDAFPPAGVPGHPDALTYFELLIAASLAAFARAKVDVVVWEVGLGGRHDATNIVDGDVSLIATIALDHTEWLGTTLTAIAREKAGILKAGRPGAVLTREPEALVAIEACAAEVGAPLRHHGADFLLEGGQLRVGTRTVDGISLGLRGAHQFGNAALAAQGVLLLEPTLTDDTLRRGLRDARWPGRLEQVGGVWLDGAHNPEGAAALAAALPALGGPVHLVFGVLGDKDHASVIERLFPHVASVEGVAPDSPRAAPPSLWIPQGQRLAPCTAHGRLDEAIAAARERARASGGVVVVAGSLFLIGSARTLLRSVGESPGAGRGA